MGSLCARRRQPLSIEIEPIPPAPGFQSVQHLAAFKKLRKEFGQKMKFIGRLRQDGKARVQVGDAVQNWTWFAYRKLHARQFHEQQVLLEKLKRDREAEM